MMFNNLDSNQNLENRDLFNNLGFFGDYPNLHENVKNLARVKQNLKPIGINDKKKPQLSNAQNQSKRKPKKPAKSQEPIFLENRKKGSNSFSIKKYEPGDKTGLSASKSSNKFESRVKTGHRMNENRGNSRNLRLPKNPFPRYNLHNFKKDDDYTDNHNQYYPSQNIPDYSKSNFIINISINLKFIFEFQIRSTRR